MDVPKLSVDHYDFLSALVTARVRFLLVGGYAVISYTKPRFTKDLDIFVERSEENLDRLARATAEFGAPQTVVDLILGIRPGEGVLFGVIPNRIDILTALDGIDRFANAWSHASRINVGGVEVPVIGVDDLIKNKETVARKQDLEDVAELRRVVTSR